MHQLIIHLVLFFLTDFDLVWLYRNFQNHDSLPLYMVVLISLGKEGVSGEYFPENTCCGYSL